MVNPARVTIESSGCSCSDEIRCHRTTLYNSIYRYDDEMIVNPHVYGIPAPHAPALHLRRLSAGCLVETYAQSFDRVWETAKSPKW